MYITYKSLESSPSSPSSPSRSFASYANQAEKLACFQRVLIIQATTFCNEIRTRAVVTVGDKCFAYGRRPPGRRRKAVGYKLPGYVYLNPR